MLLQRTGGTKVTIFSQLAVSSMNLRALESNMANLLSAGTSAPDFTLNVTPDQKLTLSELRGQPVVLAFYPADWSPVCGDQMALYNEILPEFQKYRAEVVGISVDGAWCHAAFAQQRICVFRSPTSNRRLSRAYMAPTEPDGFERALFVIDPEGDFLSYLSPIGVNPGATAFANLKTWQSRAVMASLRYQ